MEFPSFRHFYQVLEARLIKLDHRHNQKVPLYTNRLENQICPNFFKEIKKELMLLIFLSISHCWEENDFTDLLLVGK